MLMKIIKASTAVICILLTVTVALRMPEALFTYIDSKGQGTIEKQDIEQTELDFLTEMSIFEKLSLKNNISEVSLKNGAINNKAGVINIFVNFSTSIFPCNFTEDSINCVPYLRSDNENNNSFIVWSVDYISEYATILADIDDETGCVLSYSFKVNFCDGEYFSWKEAEDFGETLFAWPGYPYTSADELAKGYAEYLVPFIVDNTEVVTDDTYPFIVDNTEEETDDTYPPVSIVDNSISSIATNDGISVGELEMPTEADYISAVLLLPRNQKETPIKVETSVNYISFNR